MIAFLLLLILIAVGLGIAGVVIHGLLYLLIIGIVIFVGALALAAHRVRRAGAKPQPR
jgi:hypothetical protein